MKKLYVKLFILCLGFSVPYLLQAQDTTFSKKNIIKLNIISPAIATLALGYERVIDESKTIQLTAFYRNRPNRNNPVSSRVSEEVQGWGITPELRLYLSNTKNSPQGFFIAPYTTYQQYQTIEDIDFGIFVQTKQVISNVFGLGVTLGGQWTFKELISIDIWGGPGYYFVDTEVSVNDFITGTNYRAGGAYSGRLGINVGFAF